MERHKFKVTLRSERLRSSLRLNKSLHSVEYNTIIGKLKLSDKQVGKVQITFIIVVQIKLGVKVRCQGFDLSSHQIFDNI